MCQDSTFGRKVDGRGGEDKSFADIFGNLITV